MDMKALERKRNEQDDVAERMRVEETKAKLAAAREGMNKEAQRLKDEKEFKEVKKKGQADAQSNRFGAAASNVGGAAPGSKWVPSHMRNAAPKSAIGGSRFGAVAASSGYQKKVDMADEELFPDLATADKMIAQEEEDKAAALARASASRKAKATAGPAWGAKPKKEVEEPVVKEEEEKPEPVEEVKVEVPVVAVEAAPAVKKPKKKKKDLSTFKVS